MENTNKMDITQSILSDITIFGKYAKYVPEIGRRETWEEICERNMAMHIRKYPQIKDEIKAVYKEFVFTKKILPSMRSMQFGGRPIELANNRMFNCAYAPVDHIDIFKEVMFLLLGGSGVGYSVQNRHIEKLPVVMGPKDKQRRFLVGDSIEGWADAVKILVESYFLGKSAPEFDYRDIRAKGARLITSGGKAPGPDPLRICIEQIRAKLNDAIGRKLKSIEAHDILCHIADAVLSGGIRRAAMIALFSSDDMDMMTCKSGAWYELNPQRGRANNSVVLHREEIEKEQFFDIWERVQFSNAGEPGIFWTNNYDLGTNPCCEISLNACQFCNLTEMNVSDVVDQVDLNARSKAAAFIGTLQAGYTDFHYLRDVWKETTEREALIGVGQTGIASGKVLGLDLKESAKVVVQENERVASLIGINKAARTTTVKPSGSSSLVLGSSSGIHAWHNDYYIRRMRVGKNEALYGYMKENFPDLIEDCYFKPHIEAVMMFPQKAPEGAIYRTESFMHLLERVKKFNGEWVKEGHRNGDNYHNVSCTISLKVGEWHKAGAWMWKNRDSYTGISVIPYDAGSYKQAPFTDCTKEEFDNLSGHLHAIDLTQVKEHDDNTNLTDQQACAGGACEVK
jgi:ribonucleoside-triphosphate reductase (thioredoxin)